ncbi:hypothetical protein L6164_028318 [Bauhinia variegata]|uniref:Uncharacterized protein n=1 Tax=Bauhinia variegata TaxID=167791 RepID=A0ACB9LVS2_BAUVA|nr:hypothetical protein L6164_028318 [Bauhinia variegata]
MARCAASFTLLLCLLFLSGFSFARIPVDQPEFDDTTTTNNNNHDQYDPFSASHPHPNPTAANTLFLPSENPDTEPATLIHLEPDTITGSKPEPQAVQSQPETSTESQSEVSPSDPDSVPFTIISFRPINRHIPRRPLPLPYRHGHRCRHNHGFRPWDPMFPRRHIPYGYDMILNNDDEKSSDRVPGGGVRQIPPNG